MVQYRRIGEILIDQGIITQRQLVRALRLQAKTGRRFGEVLTSAGWATEEDIARCLAEQYDYPLADLDRISPEPEAVAALERGFALSHLVLPVKLTKTDFVCVISDPVDVATTDIVALQTGRRPHPMLSSPSRLLPKILAAYGLDWTVEVSPAQPEAAPRRRALRLEAQQDREALLRAVAVIAEPLPPKGFLTRLLGA